MAAVTMLDCRELQRTSPSSARRCARSAAARFRRSRRSARQARLRAEFCGWAAAACSAIAALAISAAAIVGPPPSSTFAYLQGHVAAFEGDAARDRQRHAFSYLHCPGRLVDQTAERPCDAQFFGAHRRDIDVDVVRACPAPGKGRPARRSSRRRRIARAYRFASCPWENAGRSPACSAHTRAAAATGAVAVAIVGDVLRGHAVGVEDGKPAEPRLDVADEFSASSSDIHFSASFSSMSRAIRSSGPGFGEVDEIVGLFDRVSGRPR